jgi:dehydrogenase/reductase SDR family member 1
MKPLVGKVAVVAGASRGLGKGIALGLGEAGATVYVTGRTRQSGDSIHPGSIYETADQVNQIGGQGIPLYCDHTEYTSIAAAFQQVSDEHKGLDILVNAVCPYPNLSNNIPRSTSGRIPKDTPFWKLPIAYWDELIEGSLRACYATIVCAIPLALTRQSALIVVLSSGGALEYWFNVPYGVDKAGTEKMIVDMAYDLRSYNIATIAL